MGKSNPYPHKCFPLMLGGLFLFKYKILRNCFKCLFLFYVPSVIQLHIVTVDLQLVVICFCTIMLMIIKTIEPVLCFCCFLLLSHNNGYIIYVDITTRENLSSIQVAISPVIYQSVRSFSRRENDVEVRGILARNNFHFTIPTTLRGISYKWSFFYDNPIGGPNSAA